MSEDIICPKCKKGKILFNESLSGIIFRRKKIRTYYCVLCDFENTKTFKINEDTYQAELIKKSNTKNIKYIKKIENE